MRRFDKKKNIQKANLLSEQIYLQKKGILVEGYHNEYEKYEPIMYIGEPRTFSNGKTVKYGDIGKYIGTEGGEECWVAFPATGFATTFSNIQKIDGQHSISENIGTDLEYITFSFDGQAYRPSKVIEKEESSNGLSVKFGLDKYNELNGEWTPIGGMLTYYFDKDNNSDKLLLTDGRYDETIDAKTMVDSKYGLYDKIKQYIETIL